MNRFLAVASTWFICLIATTFARPETSWRVVVADGSTTALDAAPKLDPNGDIASAQGGIPAATVLEIRAPDAVRPEWPRTPQAVLAGGDRIAGRVEAIDGTSIRLQSARLDKLAIPLSRVSVLWFADPPDDRQLQDAKWDFLTQPRRRDVVVLKTGERIDGTLRDLRDDRLRFADFNDNKPRERDIARADILAIALNTELTRNRKLVDPHAFLALRDGSRLTVLSPSIGAGKLRATTTWKQSIEIDVAAIASLRPENRGPVYLHDLKPVEYIYTPLFAESVLWQSGLNSQLGPLRLREADGVSLFDRGIGTHSQSSLSFDLAKKYERFDCLVGLDAVDGRGGEAEVLLRLDGKEVAESRQTLKSGDPARRLSVSVRGGSRLTLEVLHGRGGPVRDAVDWCNAVLIP